MRAWRACWDSFETDVRARGYGFVRVCGDSFETDVRPRVVPFGTANAASISDAGDGVTSDHRLLSMAPTPSGRGYWLVASDGGIFGFGDAGFFGSTGGAALRRPVVAVAASPSGRGYWVLA